MADNRQKWIDATHQILTALDIPSEYRALGLDITSSQPTTKGWLQARAFGVEDNSPSAGVNVNDPMMLGRYKDFRSGETMTLFDFAATKVGRFAGDWREARNHYARQAGVDLPSGAEELVADRFEFSDTSTHSWCLNYAAGKPGVTAMAIRECGGVPAINPKKLSPERTNHLIAFPMYGDALTDLEPIGWHCVCQNPRLKIRIYQGEGREPKLVGKMSAGSKGMMGADRLKRLAEADVVNIAEGITDLLACQAALAAWRTSDPDNRKHVVIGVAGCSMHPENDWLPHFAGKEVRVWFDVGDENNAGQDGAKAWVGAMLKVTDKVRNCQLPLGPEGGKNDLRAWLAGDLDAGQSGHGYADMCEIADATPFIDAADQTAQVSTEEAIIANLGMTVIGEYEGRNMIEVYSNTRKKGGTIMDINRLTIPTLVQLLGKEPVEQYVYEGRECPPDKYELKAVKLAIAHTASDKTFYGDEKFGAGIWEHDGQLVLVKAKEIGLLKNGRIEQSHVPFVNGRILDCGRGSGEWYDLPVLNRYLSEAVHHEWCKTVIDEAVELFGRWNWVYEWQAPAMVVGLAIASWLQSVWQWRPQVYVTGNSNTGKTILLQEVLAKGLFGDLSIFAAKPTEAAINQHIKHHSKVCFVDEFERDAHRQRILELFRTTSRGGMKIRGTADHRGISFRLRHIPWLSSIETGLTKEADKNRFIILELQEVTPEKRAAFWVPQQPYLRDLGAKLLAIGLVHCHEARRLAAILQNCQFGHVPSRCMENFALPCAILAAANGLNDEQAKQFLGTIIKDWDFGFQDANDHAHCLAAILTATVDLRGGEKLNVSTLLSDTYAGEKKAALDRIGVRKVEKKKTREMVLWIYPDTVRRTILRGTDYENHTIEQYLMRFPGAKRSKQRLGGHETFGGIEIPMDVVSRQFEQLEDDKQETGNLNA